MRFIYAVLIGGIVYGSLFPFDFISPGSWNVFSDEFLATLFARTSRGDLLGNIALFIPLGVIARLVMPPNAGIRNLLLHGLLALFVAVMVQVLQLALPTRDPALQDAIWNMLGWVIGGAMARLITRFGIVDWRPDQERQHWLVPVCLMLCWVAYDFFPYIPTIDFQGYKDALKPLLLNPLFKLDSFLMRLVAWLLFALSMDYVWGAEKTRRVFPLVSLGSLPLKVAIVNNGLNVHVVAAVVLANVLWAIVGSRHPPPYSLVAKLIVVAIVAMGILPLDYDFDYARTFHLIPFAGAMNGSMVVNFLSIVLKSYLFGGFFWVLIQLRASLAPAIILLSIVVLGVEIVQVFSVEHTAEITDVFILIIIGFMVHSVAPREQFGYSRISND